MADEKHAFELPKRVRDELAGQIPKTAQKLLT
jgi:hypothetical protein